MEKCTYIDWFYEVKICTSCGGDVHSHFGDENADMDYWLYYHCHKCGEYYADYEWEDLKVLDESENR